MKGPVFSMSNVLSKFLSLGYALDEIVAAVTSNAAEWLGRPELGRIQVGDPANLTLFTLQQESAVLVDSEGEERVTDKVIHAKGVVMGGEFIKCEIRA